MKKRNIFAAAFALLIAFSSCEKSNSECKLIPAKVLRYDCDRVIFQLLTTEAIGDANWEDVQTGLHYKNVVSYYNICKIGEIAKGEKITLYASVKNDTVESHNLDCITCKAISPNPPQVKVDFVEISTSPCKPTSGN